MSDPLALFAPLPRAERIFVRARARTAPLHEVVRRTPPAARVVDVGCGHGLLSAMLALDDPARTVMGIDPDARKIAYARRGPGTLTNVSFRLGGIDALLPDHETQFDAVVVADVLYLLPSSEWYGFLDACRRLLRPGGLLLMKETEGDGSWKHLKCMAQEWVTVRVLRKTQSSGALGLMPRAFMEEQLRSTGFDRVTVIDLSRGYSTPHVLYAAA
jgi:2-polyprenyl-6-hydroxyphenyl methylase/3-demethylubiquinone-9 3-methyltransferase